MFGRIRYILGSLFILLFWFSCRTTSEETVSNKLFTQISTSQSGIDFANTIEESDSFNYYNFPYIYMGGGVATADFNNDGLTDIYVTGNMVENKLYLNKGNFQFEDISILSGVQGDNRWYTGVTIVDINHDGYMDIYLSVSGIKGNTRNQLFVNNGDLTFKEMAGEYGIDDLGNSIQATFFDYDNDGDLDLFVANYPPVPLSQGNTYYAGMMTKNDHANSGHLYRNNGANFTDVTKEAGVQNFGLTLGVSSADLNGDGWADLYLSNDFNVPDYFYLNNGDGTFREVLSQSFGHTSMFGMGIDVADFDNDGLLDLVQADMTPEDYLRSKVNMASMSPASFWEAVDLGFHYQYMQNSLQLNNGNTREGLPLMSEVSRMAGISTTDWSWSTLFADFDNDGWKDLYITNGMKRDVNDNDINDRSNAVTFQEAYKPVPMDKYPSEPISNYVFRNNGDFTFQNVAKDWGLAYDGFSNGMAYADLDNDGDLDIIINNLDQMLSVFENKSNSDTAQFLRVKLKGPDKNPFGFGTKLTLQEVNATKIQVCDIIATRGFQSAIEPIGHFGLGDYLGSVVINVVWPDGKQEKIKIDKLNQTIDLDYVNAVYIESSTDNSSNKFEDITKVSGIDFVHQENSFDDFINEPLLPHRYSTQGPGLAVGDINGDGLEDFFVGNASGNRAALYIQDTSGRFRVLDGPWQEDAAYEDTGALFFDVDGDGDLDLYVVSGGHDPNNDPSIYLDRLYINTPQGFVKSKNSLPKIYVAGKVIAAFDYDNDGDLDLFIGGRNVPGKYPFAADSYILKNNGQKDHNLKFEVLPDNENPGLKEMGLVTSAVWADINNDGWTDLIVTGEWMPIKVFINKKGILEDSTKQLKMNEKTGWWYSLSVVDLDNDGNLDIVAGNLGLNYKYKASQEKPFEVFAADFDKNGHIDIVLGQHKEGKLLPVRGRECSSQQIPAIKRKFETYREFASADIFEIYGKSEVASSLNYKATSFGHYWLRNDGHGNFQWQILPGRSQLSPINSIIPFNYNNDEYMDLLVVGNLYDSEVETPRADSGVGLVLENNGGKEFKSVSPSESDLMVNGNIQRSVPIKVGDSNAFLFVGSNEPAKLFMFTNH